MPVANTLVKAWSSMSIYQQSLVWGHMTIQMNNKGRFPLLGWLCECVRGSTAQYRATMPRLWTIVSKRNVRLPWCGRCATMTAASRRISVSQRECWQLCRRISQMITWPMTSRGPKRSNSWPHYLWGTLTGGVAQNWNVYFAIKNKKKFARYQK